MIKDYKTNIWPLLWALGTVSLLGGMLGCSQDNAWKKPEALRARVWIYTDSQLSSETQSNTIGRDSVCLYFVDERFGIMESFTYYGKHLISREFQPFLYGQEEGDVWKLKLPKSELSLQRAGKDVLSEDEGHSYLAYPLPQESIAHVNEMRLQCGPCGPSALWRYESGIYLKIYGEGPMEDYSRDNPAPWIHLKVNVVEIANGITVIGERAFSGLQLTGISGSMTTSSNVRIPASVERIGPYAFSDIPFLNVGIAQESNLKIIDEHAFENSGLHSFRVPAQVEEIRDYAFYHVQWLQLFLDTRKLKKIGAYAFTGLGGRPYLPPNLKAASITIPASVEYLGDGALQGYIYQFILERIPAHMGKNPFVSVVSEGALFLREKEPPTIAELPLSCSLGLDNWSLVVPIGSGDAYRATAPWNKIKSITEQ